LLPLCTLDFRCDSKGRDGSTHSWESFIVEFKERVPIGRGSQGSRHDLPKKYIAYFLWLAWTSTWERRSNKYSQFLQIQSQGKKRRLRNQQLLSTCGIKYPKNVLWCSDCNHFRREIILQHWSVSNFVPKLNNYQTKDLRLNIMKCYDFCLWLSLPLD
jgi:hypothetical protein